MDIKVMCNDNSNVQARIIKYELKKKGFNIVDNNPDVIFIIGGDGTFLRSIRTQKYDSFPIYVGINSGNLGYLQDVSCKQVGSLIDFLSENKELLNSKYINKMYLAQIVYHYNDGSVVCDNAINELQISGKKYHKIEFSLSDGIDFKEDVVSSGIVISTPYGSTAYNKSMGGPIFCQGVNAICATLIAPIQNSKTKDYIVNSLISNRFCLELLSDTNDIEVYIDGQEIDINISEISSIDITIGSKCIYKLNYNCKSYSKNMLEKMLKNNSL